MQKGGWRVWIDTGGTFTDVLAVDPEGRHHRAKVLSSASLRGVVDKQLGPGRLRIRERWDAPPDLVRGFRFRLLHRTHPEVRVASHDPSRGVIDLTAAIPETVPGDPFEVVSPEEAPVLATRLLTGTPAPDPLPVDALRLATTLGTNALLERRGARIALFITEGFGDLPSIGNQQRPDLFALDIRKPEPLYEAVVEVPERIGADGAVVVPLDVEALEPRIRELRAEGIDTAAVALMHGYRYPEHEREVERALTDAGFRHVSCSSELAPFIRLVPRAATCVVDGYLSPILRRYLDRVRATLEDGHLHVMTSAGGLVGPKSFRPKESLLSGPAGGVVGAALAGRRAGFERVIAFDMGGTSTDVSRVDGDFEYVFEHEVGDAHLVAPALAIETVAAGGGSICRFDGQRLRVGPESAGAEPGPACYSSGGPLTLTDVNLLLGRLNPDRFGIPIDPGAARRRVAELIDRVERESGESVRESDVLEGLLDIANERMADAIRRISLRRGYDPAEYALVAFGGAGAQHACAVARRLGISTVVVPPDAGLLSALGLGHAVIERFAEQQVLRPLDEVEDRVEGWLDELGRRARDDVRAEGVPASEITIRRRIAHLRFVGQDATLEVELESRVSPRAAFERRYETVFGHRLGGRAVELESLRVVASSRPVPAAAPTTGFTAFDAKPGSTRRVRIDGRTVEAPVFARESLRAGARLTGPAVVDEAHSAAVVERGWRAEVDGAGSLVLREAEHRETLPAAERPEAVRLELFTNRFRTIAREMGERLRHTAISTNVKERLDFSCAVLDPEGVLIVNAPHIPVHLGALGMCVRRVRESLALGPGDVAVTNHPGFGGSHLPDITVVTPVHLEPDRDSPLLGYVASRAHHAEIGGSRPGSMPPAATSLAEEGVVIAPMLLAHAGEPRWDELRSLLEGAPFPTRAVEDNLADLRAAVAAGHAGAEALRALARVHGVKTVHSYMHALTALAERRIRDALERIPDGTYSAEERLDDGSPLRVRLDIRGEQATIDFGGSAPVHPGNLNATPAVVASAVIYVLRLMIDEPLPLNEGLMRAVSLRIPRGMLHPPFPDDPAQAPAVVGGNVETSQRIVDTLLKALGLAACSQGTMNNVLFGNERFGYYETVCGGAGAGPGFAGASAVHTHMTNTRITDPEVLEHRYPVRVERFAMRTGSGGEGEFRGGDGVVREITFLEEVDLSVLTQHRTVAPYGLAGGGDGATGAQRVVRASGEVATLGSIDGCRVAPGDRLVLETPGGGGYGRG